jgi:hypothetical protein
VRGPLPWILAGVGILAVILVGAAIGGRDDSGETVPAGDWAQNVCGAVGVWRGDMEVIVDDLRDPSAQSVSGEEPQSETPQGRTGFARESLERAVEATDTLVEGIENAGAPDTPQGEEVADRVSEWANDAQDELEETQDGLDEEADTLEEAIEQLTDASRTIAAVLVGGTQTIAEVTQLDPELVGAFRGASTCEELREETGS